MSLPAIYVVTCMCVGVNKGVESEEVGKLALEAYIKDLEYSVRDAAVGFPSKTEISQFFN